MKLRDLALRCSTHPLSESLSTATSHYHRKTIEEHSPSSKSILSRSLPNFHMKSTPLRSPASRVGSAESFTSKDVLTMTKLSQQLQEKLSRAILSFQTIMRQIGGEFHGTSTAAAVHTTEVSGATNVCLILIPLFSIKDTN